MRTTQQHILATIFFALLLAATKWPVIQNITTHFYGGVEGDPGLYVWLTKLPLFSYDTHAFYPYQYSRAFSDNFFLPSAAVKALILIGVPHTAAYNIALLFANWANGFSAYLLGALIAPTCGGAILLGAFTMLALPISAQLGHPQLHFFFFIPLGIYCLLKNRYALGGVILGLTSLTSTYYTVYLAVIFFVIVSWVVIKERQLNNLKASGWLICGAAPFVLLNLPYIKIIKDFGVRGLHEFTPFAASLSSYLSAPPLSKYYPSHSHSEAHLFPGVIAIAIVLLGIFHLLRDSYQKKHSWLLLLLGVLFILLSFGDKTPLAELFINYFPGFGGVRAIGRAGIVGVFLLIAGSLAALRLPAAVYVAMTAGIIFESQLTGLPIAPVPPLPPIFSTITTLKEPILIVPFAGELSGRTPASHSDFASKQVNYMLWSIDGGAGVTIVNGYSGIQTKIIREYPFELNEINIASERAIKALTRIAGVRHVLSLGAEIKESPFFTEIAHDSSGNYLYEFNYEREITPSFYFFLPRYAKSVSWELTPTAELSCDGVPISPNAPLPPLPNHSRPAVCTFNLTTSAHLRNLHVVE